MSMQNVAARQPETRRQPAEPAAGRPPEANHELTVILPAFNEEQRLPWTLCQLGMFLDQWGIDYRVVVADDGSSDRTAQLAGLLGPRFSTVRLAEHRGKGSRCGRPCSRPPAG